MEVLEVVKGMNRDKAPGSDGFSMAFFQDCWDVIKTNLMRAFQDFHAHNHFEKSLNASFIGDMSLKVAFPAQFGIASAKDASVAINLEYFGGSNQWNVSFAREAYDWEVDGLASFF
jgi:hypothetical protein